VNTEYREEQASKSPGDERSHVSRLRKRKAEHFSWLKRIEVLLNKSKGLGKKDQPGSEP
jgi:hypothetical protein